MNENTNETPIQKKKLSELNARSSIIIFLSYILAQIVAGIGAGAFLALYFTVVNSGFDHEAFSAFLKQFSFPILALSLFASGAVVLFLGIRYGKGLFTDRNHTGIALHPGSLKSCVLGITLGFLIALVYVSISVLLYPPDPDAETGNLTKLLMTPGPERVFWFLAVILFAPAVEEYIFRGLMFAGFTKSYGIFRASVIVTLLFVSVHAFEAAYYPPAFGGIALIAIVLVMLRIRYRALGPAVAAHLGYNLVIAAGALAGG